MKRRRPWWFIVYEEESPSRQTPLVAHSITRHDPVVYLNRTNALIDKDSKPGTRVSLRAFWRMDRTPTKAELEEFCQDSVL